jgi:hypothetical protein
MTVDRVMADARLLLLCHSSTRHLSIPGYSDEQVGYHAYLLVDAGLVKGSVSSMGGDSPEATITSLTWAGHECADGARDDRGPRALAAGARHREVETRGTPSDGDMRQRFEPSEPARVVRKPAG